MSKYLDVSEVAARLGISKPTAYRWVKDLPSKKEGRGRTFNQDDVDLLRDSSKVRKAGPTAEQPDFAEIGSSSIRRSGSTIEEERLRQLRGREGAILYREMRLNDPVIAAVFLAIENALRRVSWRVKPVTENPIDLEAATFVDQCIGDLSFSFSDELQFILGFLEQGHSILEIVMKRRLGPNPPSYIKDAAPSLYNDNRVGWRKWAPRPTESLASGQEWMFDENGGIQGIRQSVPERSGEIREIPIERLLLFRTTVAPSNSPTGIPIHRAAYTAWWKSQGIEEIEGIGIERDLAGLPVIYMGADTRKAGSNSDFDQAKEIVVNLRADEQAGVVFPYPKLGTAGDNRGMLLELLSTSGRRAYNAQPLNAKILTSTGWMRMSDAKVGDEIICPLGYKSVIEGVFPLGKRPVFRITTSDGRITLADAEHLWVVTNLIWKNRVRKGGTLENAHPLLKEYKVMDTHGLTNEMEKRGTHLYFPVPQKSEFIRTQLLPIDPYVLGVIIGDGWCKKQGGAPQFVSMDKEIADEVERRLPIGYTLGSRRVESIGKATQYTIKSGETRKSSMRQCVEDMGLIGTTAHKKFIPGPYLWAGVNERLELLQGLLDTDGSISKDGRTSLSTSSEILALNALHIIRSLGGTATLHSCHVTSYCQPFDKTERKIDSIHYKVGDIRLPKGLAPFKLSRKLERVRTDWESTHYGYIKIIEYVGEMDVQCIKVSSPSQMYITDDFIPTHNTTHILERLDRRKALACLAQFIMLGMEAVGSFALGRLQADIFILAVSAWAENIAETINRYAIPRLFRYNVFPGLMQYPKIVPSDVGIPNLEEMAIYVNTLVGAGLLKPGPELERHLRQIAHLPQRDEFATDAEPEGETPAANDRAILRAARAALILNRLRLLQRDGLLTPEQAQQMMGSARDELVSALGGESLPGGEFPLPAEEEDEEAK